MDVWQSLEIAPTKDLSTIKKAYATRLKQHRPDEDREGFQQLREAYQEAVHYAENTPMAKHLEVIHYLKDSQQPLKKLGIKEELYKTEKNIAEGDQEKEQAQQRLQEEIATIYNCYETRIKKIEWQKLLNNEMMWDFKSKQKVNNLLLTYLKAHHFLPQDIWQLLDDVFEWTSNKAIYKGTLYEPIVSYIYEMLHRTIPLDYREMGEIKNIDYDEYFLLRESLDELIQFEEWQYGLGKWRAAEKIYNQDKELWRLKALYYLEGHNIESAIKYVNAFVKERPSHVQSQLLVKIIDYEKQLLNQEISDQSNIKYELALAYRELGLLERASECLIEIGMQNDQWLQVEKLLRIIYGEMEEKIRKQKRKKVCLEMIPYKEEQLRSKLAALEGLKGAQEAQSARRKEEGQQIVRDKKNNRVSKENHLIQKHRMRRKILVGMIIISIMFLYIIKELYHIA